ncbi:T7SS effector LXG polymorphic toxin [Lactococcus allomyrinae]|uniref:LXG domain-containing protein n=1 Tax=Lactococcus allomyrinae TaxID=2419773 RepID=A0A387BHV5_9LACT|nr:T7SS effector LXG polymorphic toxin [Lactococcus allomyrinae]AYG00460.1 hypothetical protein D7I46_04770 [Lactococcus allomyrinae]
MGLIYSSSDSQNLMDGMNANLAIAKAAVQDVVSASRTLTGAIGAGKLLDGAAFNAGKDLFSALIIPTITRASSAFDDTKKHLSRYESANNEVSSEGVLDEDKLNAKKTSTQAIKTATDNTASTFRTIASAADSVSLPFVGPMLNAAAQNLENYSESLQQDIDKIDQKLKKLRDFNSAVNGLFNNDLNNLKIIVQSVTVLSDTVVHSNGTYSLPAGTDASWFTSVKSAKDVSETEKLDKVLSDKKANIEDVNVILAYAKAHPNEEIPQSILDWIKKNASGIGGSFSNGETVGDLLDEVVGKGISKFGGLVNVFTGIAGPDGVGSFVLENSNGIGRQVVQTGEDISKFGKYAGKGFAVAGFAFGMYDDMADNHKTVGQALTHNIASTAIGAGATAGASFAIGALLVSNPVGWAAIGVSAAAIGIGVGATALFNLAYDNNFLGLKSGLDWAGSKIDEGLKDVGQAVGNIANAINPFKWGW